MGIRQLTERSTRRTALVTATGVAAVVVAGAFAVSANVGILDAAGDNKIGSLSAAGDLVPASTTTVGTAGDDANRSVAESQDFVVDDAGTVTVNSSTGGITLGGVVANPGWTWSAGAADATRLSGSFTDGTRTLEFSATRNVDGTIAADVQETVASSPDTASSPGDQGDDDDNDDNVNGDDDNANGDDDNANGDDDINGDDDKQEKAEPEEEEYEHAGRDDDD